MGRIIETVLSIEELEEIKDKVGANVEIVLAGRREGKIPLNVVLIKGSSEEVRKFLDRLKLARAGG
ncbi:TIGR04140 family protein [Pyrococcus kukulkanii]|uniref:TIGR04140 family protein n=1 Tax=Pyrococcus kukulkanii TaxID=1609559 RepID=UPI003562310A